jgi:IMP cyclohydrolase
MTRDREPDAPHYTPRISGMVDKRQQPGQAILSILKANPANPELSDRFTYRPAMPTGGLGYGLTTYMGDGSPLPSFTGDPLLLPCVGEAEAVLNTYWEALNADNRVSLAVKRIPDDGSTSQIFIQNRFAG